MILFGRLIEKFREYRTSKLNPIGKLLLKLGINANIMTSLSLILGLVSIYFLFNNYLLFLISAGLHLLTDGLDGVIARASQETRFGQYFDWTSDRIIEYLILIKVGWFLQDYYVYIIVGILLIVNLVYLTSKLSAPVIATRTAYLISLVVFSNPFYPYTNISLTAGYLIVGVLAVFYLAKQLQWFVSKV